MDAEGCIRLAKQSRNEKTYYSPRVYMSNQSRKLMQWAVHHFGGSFVRNKNSGPGLDWYIWYLQSTKSAKTFLDCVGPYLRIKKPQADILAGFCEGSLSEEEKETVFTHLSNLKKLGSVTTETHNDYSKADFAYLAGFFDGEGCIRINRTPAKNTVGYHLHLSITNKDRGVIDFCHRTYGGLVRHKSAGCYDWILSGKTEIERFLLCTIPYLVCKSDEAKLALEYIRIGNRTRCPEIRQQAYEKMAALKKSKIQSELASDCESVSAEMPVA